jgi:hypothetical protein
MAYAKGTAVPVSRSIDEIRSMLLKAGATRYAYGEDPDQAAVQFELDGRHYRFAVRRPTEADVPRQVYRVPPAALIDAEWRRRWRARVLWIKAQIEFAEVEPVAFHEAMLAHLVLPDGRTLGRWADPQIAGMYERGGMPPLLGDGR